MRSPFRYGFILVGSYRHEVVEVNLSEDDLRLAIEHVKKVFKGSKEFLTEDGLDSQGHYAGEGYTSSNFILGALGQGAVSGYLNNDVIEGLTQYIIGGPDNGLDVVTRAGSRRLQVKAFNWILAAKGSRLPDDWMIVNDDHELETAESNFDYFVGCQRIEPDWIRVLGVISPADFKLFSVDRTKEYGCKGLEKRGLQQKDLCQLKTIECFARDFGLRSSQVR